MTPHLMFGGMQIVVKDAQQQMRTTRDVEGPWIRPRVPSKGAGRKGTRRIWKRRHPPHRVYLYREPDDVIVLYGHMIIATPRQADFFRRAIPAER